MAARRSGGVPRDTIRMVSGGDTVRDAEAPDDVKALFARIERGERVERTLLVEQLERMLRLVTSTDAAFDGLVVMLRRSTPLVVPPGRRAPDLYGVHALGDGTALLHTTWTMSAKGDFLRVLTADHAAWASEHDDPRGFPVLRAAQLDVARAASSYDDALYLLGEDVVFAQPKVRSFASARSRAR